VPLSEVLRGARSPLQERRSVRVAVLAMVALAVSSGSALADSVSTRDFFTQGGMGLAGISCPTARLCVAVGQQGIVVTSTHPAAAPPNGSPTAWQLADIDSPNFLYAVSCTRSEFCAAVDGAGRVLTSAEPTGGKRAWRARKISRNPLYAVSCASSRLCAALDDKGNVLSSANPLGGASTWHRIRLAGNAYMPRSVSCPRPSLCVVGGDYAAGGLSGYAQVSVSTDPTGGPRAWRTFRLHTHYPRNGDLVAISCPSAKLCVAGGSTELLTSTDPAGGPRAWKDAYLSGEHFPTNSLIAISCATVRLCVAVDNSQLDMDGFALSSENAFISIDPTGGSGAWVKSTLVQPGNTIRPTGVSCVTGLCVVVDDHGVIIIRLDPGAPARQAARPHLSGESLSGVARDHPRLSFIASARARGSLPGARSSRSRSARRPGSRSPARARASA